VNASPSDAETASPWGRRLAVGLVALLVLGPLLYKHTPREIARWYQASAIEQFQRGREDEALRSIEKALRWAPDDSRLYLQVAAWRRLAGRHEEALEWCAKARARGSRAAELIDEESENLWSLKRWDAALDRWKQFAAEAEDSGLGATPFVLNGMAYARALANTELDEALRGVEAALAVQGPDASILDTRGFIHYRRGNLEAARRDLDNALAMIGVPLSGAKESDPQSASADSSADSPADSPAKSPADSPAKSPEKSPEKSPADSPAKSPEKSPAKSPEKSPATPATDSPSREKPPTDQPPRDQPTPVVDAAKGPTDTEKTRLDPKFSEPISELVQRAERQSQRVRAVLIYHRWLVLEKLGDTAAAAADRRRIESLGFSPDDSLF
jgi:hypothetical protein